MNLLKDQSVILDDRVKGMPGGMRPVSSADVGDLNWNILCEDLPLPIAVINENALQRNSQWMNKFLDMTGASICPHGKSSMSPEILNLHLRSGAWGITAATSGHIQIYRRFGVKRILLANQLIGRQNIRYVLDELRGDPDFDFYCLVDSTAGLEALLDAIDANPIGRPVQLLLEVGALGARTGVRDDDEAKRLASKIGDAYPQVVLRGLETYEAIFAAKRDEEVETRVTQLLADVVRMAKWCESENLFGEGAVILSAGGSAYFDLVVEVFSACRLQKPFMTLLRCSSYLTHDSGLSNRTFARLLQRRNTAEIPHGGLTHSLEVWAYVQSIPETGLALMTMGKRDVSFDIEMPIPLHVFRPGKDKATRPLDKGCDVASLNDQHAYLRFPPSKDIRVGDMIGFGVSHACTTFDKWRILLTVDDEYSVTGAITTWF